MKRYAQSEVAEAHAQAERCVFTPHAQIVLSAEVRALETILARIEACAAASAPAGMTRPTRQQVDDAIAVFEGCDWVEPPEIASAYGKFLAAEVRALETILARVEACIASAWARPETWTFRDLVSWLRAALKGND